MERPRCEDGQQQMDTQAHHVGPREGRRNVGRQRTRWADQLKRLAGDQWFRSAKDSVLWKELKKNFNSIGLAHL